MLRDGPSTTNTAPDKTAALLSLPHEQRADGRDQIDLYSDEACVCSSVHIRRLRSVRATPPRSAPLGSDSLSFLFASSQGPRTQRSPPNRTQRRDSLAHHVVPRRAEHSFFLTLSLSRCPTHHRLPQGRGRGRGAAPQCPSEYMRVSLTDYI